MSKKSRTPTEVDPRSNELRTHLWDVEHPYYCSESNFYSRKPYTRFECWSDFMDEFAEADLDMNHIFRWDWEEDRHRLKLFMIKQRKGIFQPIEIYGMTPEDEPSVREFLRGHWETILAMWEPLA